MAPILKQLAVFHIAASSIYLAATDIYSVFVGCKETHRDGHFLQFGNNRSGNRVNKSDWKFSSWLAKSIKIFRQSVYK